MSWKTLASQNWNAHCEESTKMLSAWIFFFFLISNYLLLASFSSNLTFLACYVAPISIVLWPFVKNKVWGEWCTQTPGKNAGGIYTSHIQCVITTEVYENSDYFTLLMVLLPLFQTFYKKKTPKTETHLGAYSLLSVWENCCYLWHCLPS